MGIEIVTEGHTPTGFQRLEFKDFYGHKCGVEIVSNGEESVWIGQEQFVMRLTPEMIAALLPYFENYIKTGELVSPEVKVYLPPASINFKECEVF